MFQVGTSVLVLVVLCFGVKFLCCLDIFVHLNTFLVKFGWQLSCILLGNSYSFSLACSVCISTWCQFIFPPLVPIAPFPENCTLLSICYEILSKGQ